MNAATLAAIRQTAGTSFPPGDYLVAVRTKTGWSVRLFDVTRERAEDSLEWFTDGSVFAYSEWDFEHHRPIDV